MAEFARASTVPAPEVRAIGNPGDDYPLPWTLQTWIDGDPATPTSVESSDRFAEDLAALIRRLRAADTRERRFSGAGRGGALSSHDDWVEYCLGRSGELLAVRRLREAWAVLRETPREGAGVMSHKDLIPANVLARDGRLVGVLDTGDFGPADPALDLVCAWHMLDAERRRRVREEIGADDAEWRRGAAWALQQALGLVWYYVDTNRPMSDLGRSTIDRILAAPEIGV